MLVNPSIDDLLLKVNNKFKLVTLAMKRSRQINEGDPEKKDHNSAWPISRSLQEIYDGDVFVKPASEDNNKEAAIPAAAEDLAIGLGVSVDSIEEDLTLGKFSDDSDASSILDSGLKAGDQDLSL